MRVESYFFLIFVLAAAIVTGSTLGLISNIKYLQGMENIASTDTIIATNDIVIDNNLDISLTNKHNEKKNLAVIQDNQALTLTKNEQRQIEEMLVRLSKDNNINTAEFIRQYQKEHNINATGTLDPMTLTAIVQQVKLEHTYSLVRN